MIKKYQTSFRKIVISLSIMYVLIYLSVHKQLLFFSLADFYFLLFFVLMFVLLKICTYVEIDTVKNNLKYTNLFIARTIIPISEILEIGYSKESKIQVYSYMYILYRSSDNKNKRLKIIKGAFEPIALEEIEKLLKLINAKIKHQELV